MSYNYREEPSRDENEELLRLYKTDESSESLFILNWAFILTTAKALVDHTSNLDLIYPENEDAYCSAVLAEKFCNALRAGDKKEEDRLVTTNVRNIISNTDSLIIEDLIEDIIETDYPHHDVLCAVFEEKSEDELKKLLIIGVKAIFKDHEDSAIRRSMESIGLAKPEMLKLVGPSNTSEIDTKENKQNAIENLRYLLGKQRAELYERMMNGEEGIEKEILKNASLEQLSTLKRAAEAFIEAKAEAKKNEDPYNLGIAEALAQSNSYNDTPSFDDAALAAFMDTVPQVPQAPNPATDLTKAVNAAGGLADFFGQGAADESAYSDPNKGSDTLAMGDDEDLNNGEGI